MGRPTSQALGRSITSGLALAAVPLLATVAVGCSTATEEPTVTPISSAPAEPEVAAAPLAAVAGSLQGFLTSGQQQRAVDDVAGVVDAWIEAAWVAGPWPRQIDATAAWPGFTPGGAEKAARDSKVTTGAHYAERVSDVVATRREVRVDLLAQQGTAHAATARVVLNLDVVPLQVDGAEQAEVADGGSRRVVLRGRLFLTREDGAWTVFGHDLARGGW